MEQKIDVCIIGLGLIGGSFGLSLKQLPYIGKIYGVDQSNVHSKEALKLGLIDEIKGLKEAVKLSKLIVLATPVNVLTTQIIEVLDLVQHQVIIDAGSTKNGIVTAANSHSMRKRFVACHPMAGTEFSGPKAAINELYKDKFNVICNAQESDQDALELTEKILSDIGMKLLYQQADEHDVHVAYVSHISHISAFALALTVLRKEKSEEQIFQLASGGFESSVRLAKSNPATWAPIFLQNRDAVLDVLDEHITVLSKFRSLLIKNDFDQFSELMTEANQIKRVLNQHKN